MRFSHFGPTRVLCDIAMVECLSCQESIRCLIYSLFTNGGSFSIRW